MLVTSQLKSITCSGTLESWNVLSWKRPTRSTEFNLYKFSDTNSTEVSQRADAARWKMLISKGILCSAHCCEPQCCFGVQQMSQLQIHVLKGMLSF